MDHSDRIYFICVIFLGYIQRRKDKPSYWLSNDLLLDKPMVKYVLQGEIPHNSLVSLCFLYF